METDHVVYQACTNCGRWHPKDGAYDQRFCCQACAQHYRRCPTCGEYYVPDNDAPSLYCSALCEAAEEGGGSHHKKNAPAQRADAKRHTYWRNR